ncbi:MAG: DUF4330 family protein [Clostridia bacterium]|nr:DUF4330 family protein [Clostridia bacterium]
MKLFDDKYRLFGKISIFDIIIILLIIGAICFAAYSFFAPKTVGEIVPVTYKVVFEKQPLGLEKNISVGDKIYNKSTGYEMGEIISLATKETEAILYNDETGLATIQKYKTAQAIELIVKGNFTNMEDRYYCGDIGFGANTAITFHNDKFVAGGVIDFIYPSETTKEGE